MQVPSDWNSWGLPGVSKFGYATYIKELTIANDGSLGIKLDHVFSSYELFINGQSIYKSGKVAKSKAEYRPYREPVVISIPERFGNDLIVAVQAANFDHLNSGIYYEPIVGSYLDLSLDLRVKQGINLFLAGGFFITGFILFGFSLLSRQLELQVFFYALFSLSLMYRMLGASPYPLHSLAPDTNFYLSITLEYLTIHTAALFGGLFVFETFRKQASKVLTRIFYIGSSISMAVVLFAGPAVFTATLKYYLFFILLYVGVFIYTIVKAKLEKAPSSNFLIAALILVFIWTLFQVFTFLNLGEIPFLLNVILVSAIIVICNIALFRTFLKSVSLANERAAQLELADTKNTMLSLISHEIKIPVSSLQMNLAMLAEAKSDQHLLAKIKDKSIDSANRSVQTIKQMLNDFLFFMSAEEQGAKELMTVELLQKKLESEVTDNVVCAAAHDLGFESRTVTLLYILRTLVNNAHKHTRTEVQRPEIHIFNTETELTIEVRDFGDGITNEALSTLGNASPRISRTQEVEGMGFYLAKELSKRLGHGLSVTQNEHGGTSAIVLINL